MKRVHGLFVFFFQFIFVTVIIMAKLPFYVIISMV